MKPQYTREDFTADLKKIGRTLQWFADEGGVSISTARGWGVGGKKFPLYALAYLRMLVKEHERESRK